MELLVSLKAEDVEPNAPHFDYDSFKPRAAARAIVFDGAKVALVYIKQRDYHMLPGGGIDDGEDIHTGLKREIAEELGCEIEVVDEVGIAEAYFDRWSRKQTDYCYTARKVGEATKSLTDFEVEEGHQVVWADNLQTATEIVESTEPANRDGKMVRTRDLTFLKQAAKLTAPRI